jgi:hypothetical protein
MSDFCKGFSTSTSYCSNKSTPKKELCSDCYKKLMKKKKAKLCTGSNGNCSNTPNPGHSWCSDCFIKEQIDALQKSIKASKHDCSSRGGVACSECVDIHELYLQKFALEKRLKKQK